MTHEKRITRITILPKSEPIFSERATHIEIDDEAAGEFLKITQQNSGDGITIEFDEWQLMKEVIEEMLADCRQ